MKIKPSGYKGGVTIALNTSLFNQPPSKKHTIFSEDEVYLINFAMIIKPWKGLQVVTTMFLSHSLCDRFINAIVNHSRLDGFFLSSTLSLSLSLSLGFLLDMNTTELLTTSYISQCLWSKTKQLNGNMFIVILYPDIF